MRLQLFFALLLIIALQPSIAAAQIKNEQTILGGALTRAGNKGMLELNDSQLADLCEQGYGAAYFVYEGATPRTVACSRGSITYRSQSSSDSGPILASVLNGMRSGTRVFVHCYNGAHASGIVAALALRQFCGLTGEAAFNYWTGSMGGYDLPAASIGKIQNRINGFVPDPNLSLTPEEQARFCN